MKTVFSIAALGLAALGLVAQTPTTLRVDVRLVNVVTTVTDDTGRFVPNLSPEDFTVLEDGVQQKISHFTQDRDVPVSVGILLDTSGSMSDKMRIAISAVERFINNIRAEDDIFLMTFARRISVEQDFTSDRKKLSKALNSLTVGGSTLLYDGLNEALGKIATGKHDKKALLVLSDGIDAGSRRSSLQGLLNNVRRSEVLIYGLGTSQTIYADPLEHVPFRLPTQASTARGPAPITNAPTGGRRGGPADTVDGVRMSVLNQFASNSGGDAFLLSNTFVDEGTSEIDEVLSKIADELRGQYTLGYYPSKPDDGSFHTIKVTTTGKYNVRARTGYQGQ